MLHRIDNHAIYTATQLLGELHSRARIVLFCHILSCLDPRECILHGSAHDIMGGFAYLYNDHMCLFYTVGLIVDGASKTSPSDASCRAFSARNCSPSARADAASIFSSF